MSSAGGFFVAGVLADSHSLALALALPKASVRVTPLRYSSSEPQERITAFLERRQLGDDSNLDQQKWRSTHGDHNCQATTKKQRKELKRRKRQEKEGIWQTKVQRRKLFPKFEIVPDSDCPQEFIDAVYSAARNVNFDGRSQFDDLGRAYWQWMAKYGFKRVEEVREGMNRKFASTQPNAGDCVRQESINKLAQAIYGQIPSNVRARFMPHNHFLIRPKNKVCQIQFKRLHSVSTSRGRVHFSFPSACIELEDRKGILGFTTHALQRICERIAPNWQNDYLELIRVVRFVAYIPHFEMTHLRDDQPAIALFSSCGPTFCDERRIYGNLILGEKSHDSTKNDPEYRLGYCPIEMNKEIAVAKTFLPPGYNGTPEHQLLLRSRLPKAEKERLLSLARDHVRDHEQVDQWLPLVKWFHENGVPQVRYGVHDREEYLESMLNEFLDFAEYYEASCQHN